MEKLSDTLQAAAQIPDIRGHERLKDSLEDIITAPDGLKPAQRMPYISLRNTMRRMVGSTDVPLAFALVFDREDFQRANAKPDNVTLFENILGEMGLQIGAARAYKDVFKYNYTKHRFDVPEGERGNLIDAVLGGADDGAVRLSVITKSGAALELSAPKGSALAKEISGKGIENIRDILREALGELESQAPSPKQSAVDLNSGAVDLNSDAPSPLKH